MWVWFSRNCTVLTLGFFMAYRLHYTIYNLETKELLSDEEIDSPTFLPFLYLFHGDIERLDADQGVPTPSTAAVTKRRKKTIEK
jgi:hypothetical protein